VDGNIVPPPLPNKCYTVIYCDPPWNFRVWSQRGTGRSASKHYHIPLFRELKSLDIPSICKRDCALFMWATYPNLKDAFSLMESWQFEYKTVAFTWVKKCRVADKFHVGMGYWTRHNPEICLLGTRGNPKRIDKGIRNLVISRIRQHSRKPDEVHERIEKLMGDVPRIELFAREPIPGWDTWGLEVEKFKE